jgi:hypothetical protein
MALSDEEFDELEKLVELLSPEELAEFAQKEGYVQEPFQAVMERLTTAEQLSRLRSFVGVAPR